MPRPSTLTAARPCGSSPQRTPEVTRRTAQLVLALPESPLGTRLRQHFESLGWEVLRAADASEVRDLAWELTPAAVVLAVDAADESGWLTCKKLLLEHPFLRVVLVGPAAGPKCRRLAEFVGAAALVPADAPPEAVVRTILGTAE